MAEDRGVRLAPCGAVFVTHVRDAGEPAHVTTGSNNDHEEARESISYYCLEPVEGVPPQDHGAILEQLAGVTDCPQ